MTLEQYANLFNLTGIGIVLAMTALVAIRQPLHYFRMWTLAYGWFFGLLLFEFVGQTLGRPLLVNAVEIGCTVLVGWYFLQTARALQDKPSHPTRWMLLILASMEAACLSILAAGVAFTTMAGIPLLAMCVMMIWLAVVMIRMPGKTPGTSLLAWIGWPLVPTAIWPLTYPIFAQTSFFWLGFLIAGALHLFVGTGMVVALQDRTAAELRKKNSELVQVDAERRNFFNTVSHELRTPLTSIVGYLEFLEDRIGGPLTPQQESFVGHMLESADQLRGLIDAILDSARIDAGTFQVKSEPFSLAATIEQAIGPLAPVLEKKRLQLSLDISEALPMAIGDSARVVQVLNNLLSNAIKFSSLGGQIRITAVREGDAVRVSVIDNGTGIPADKVDRVFDPFYQVDGSLTREHGGAGLGLSIVRRLVILMGGTVSVESRLGEGSVFSFTLTAVAASAAVAAPQVT